MKLAYIVENYGQLSETFVTDLVTGLGQEGIVGRVFTDKSFATPYGGFDLCETPFCHKGQFSTRWLGRCERLLGGSGLEARLGRRSARKILLPALQSFGAEVAYIDHGNNAILAREALVELGVPFVVHFHGRDASKLLASTDYQAEVRNVFCDALAVIVASHHIGRRLVLAGCPPEKIRHVSLGVDFNRIPEPQWEQRRGLPFSVIHVGRLVEKKQPIALLHAFSIVSKHIPEATLTFIGDGPLRSQLEDRVAILGLGASVRMAGPLAHDSVLEELQQHRIYAQHCVTDSQGDQEGFSVSMLEAAACGLPVVSTFHDGIPENVLDGKTGFLVPEYDFEAMAERIIRLLIDHELAEKMGAVGRLRVAENFRIEQRVAAIHAILREVVFHSTQPEKGC